MTYPENIADARAIEAWGTNLVVAAGEGIFVVDAQEPSVMSVEEHIPGIAATPEGLRIELSVDLGTRITDLWADGGFAYANLAWGGSSIVTLSGPFAGAELGEHSVDEWVEGTAVEAGRVYQKRGNWIDVAVLE